MSTLKGRHSVLFLCHRLLHTHLAFSGAVSADVHSEQRLLSTGNIATLSTTASVDSAASVTVTADDSGEHVLMMQTMSHYMMTYDAPVLACTAQLKTGS